MSSNRERARLNEANLCPDSGERGLATRPAPATPIVRNKPNLPRTDRKRHPRSEA